MQLFKYFTRKYLDLSFTDGPHGPLVDTWDETIGADDFSLNDKSGFICHVGSAGDLVVETYKGGGIERTFTFVAADVGSGIRVDGIPVLIRKIKGTSTVTSVRIGIIA